MSSEPVNDIVDLIEVILELIQQCHVVILLCQDKEDSVLVTEPVGFLEADGQVHVLHLLSDHGLHLLQNLTLRLS